MRSLLAISMMLCLKERKSDFTCPFERNPRFKNFGGRFLKGQRFFKMVLDSGRKLPSLEKENTSRGEIKKISGGVTRPSEQWVSELGVSAEERE